MTDRDTYHCRYYRIAGITLRVKSDLPITDKTFHPKFKLFETDGPGEDNVTIHHRFNIADLYSNNLGEEIYNRPPWIIYRKGTSWIYVHVLPKNEKNPIRRIGIFNSDYRKGIIYNMDEKCFRRGNLNSLTLFPTDQVLLAQLLGDRQGCYLHSCGVIYKKYGLVFAGHSGAGKSTMATLLRNRVQILCDDRIIIMKHTEGFRIYGTWSHGDIQEVSAESAPLRAIIFLVQAKDNCLIPLEDGKEIRKRILACLVKPLETPEWWGKLLALVEVISQEVPCYLIHFNKNNQVAELLKEFELPV